MDAAHRRKNPLTNEWVLVSPHRNKRPWQGAVEVSETSKLPSHVADCPLCPSNVRANGEANDAYTDTFVFTNDFAALTSHLEPQNNHDPLFESEAAEGEARVICFAPDHNKTLAELSVESIVAVVDTWQSEYKSLSDRYGCVHIFENKGEIMGCSQPHPHGQIWAHNHYSTEINKENEQQLKYFLTHERPLLADYLDREIALDERIVCINAHWVVLVPYWAKWPFETLLICRDDARDFISLNIEQKRSLAEILKKITVKYDNLFATSFPYSMGWHCAPADLTNSEHWRMHAHFYPPLLRSASIKKHMVGYEMLAESQRDLTPEQAAAVIRETSEIHFKD